MFRNRTTNRERRRVTVITALRTRGGVGNYYDVVLPCLGDEFVACRVGSPIHGQGAMRRAIPVVLDAVRLARVLVTTRADTMLVNPSLDARSLVRDGLSILIAKALGRRVVVFFRGWDVATELRLRGLRMSMFRGVFFRADACIVLFSGYRATLRQWGFRRPIHVLSTVAARGCFDAGAARESRLTHSRDGVVRVLFMGWLARDKGILEVIEAFALARRRMETLELVVVGEGPAAEDARLVAAEHGVAEVVFRGHLSGKAKFVALSEADIFILPSGHGEGMPNAVLEALASGLTVIASPVGGLRDFLFDRRLGMEAADVSPEGLAALLVKAAGNSAGRAEFAVNGRDFAKRHFTPDTCASALREVIDLLRDRDGSAESQVEITWYEVDGEPGAARAPEGPPHATQSHRGIEVQPP